MTGVWRWTVLAVALIGPAANGWPDEADDEARWIRGSATIDFESKILSYGLPDADEPNFLPYAELTFLDVVSVGGRFNFDMTDIGERMGRGDRTWDCWEMDFPVNARYTFSSERFRALPTSIELGAGYRYEYHPARTEIRDTQFWLADIALPDLWVVPRFSYERDVIRDNGTYLNLSLSHTFPLFECLDLCVSIAQGWGDRKRVGGYLTEPDMTRPLDRSGLMDTQLRFTLDWEPADWVVVSGFVAYSDFLLDSGIRDASRNYIRQIDGGDRNNSWNFPVGISATVRF